MKKKAIFSILGAALIISIAAYAFTSRKESKPVEEKPAELTKSQMSELYDLGFTRAKNIISGHFLETQKYWGALGLEYVSTSSITSMLSTRVNFFENKNELVLGKPGNFIGEIPEASSAKISENYKKYCSVVKEEAWFTPEGNYYDESTIKSLSNSDQGYVRSMGISTKRVMIVAPVSQFDMKGKTIWDGRVVDHKPDPIVLVRADKEGYIILAQW